MAKIDINLGTPPSGQDGDPVRTAFEKTNTMFSEVYSKLPADGKQAMAVGAGGWQGVSASKSNANAAEATGFYAMKDASNSPFSSLQLLTSDWGYDPRWQSQLALGVSVNRFFARSILKAQTSVTNWAEFYHTDNGQNDPAVNGIMQSYIVSGFVITKYLSGDLHIRGIAPLTRQIGANEIAPIDINLPVSLVNGSLGYAFSGYCVARVQITYDSFGVVNQFLASPSVVTLIIRNGATPQTFSPIVNVWGRWK